MEVLELSQNEYRDKFTTNFNVYVSEEFCTLNCDKADNVFFLAFQDNKIRLGIIVGVRENVVLSPYSAPFGGFSYIKNEIRISQIEEAVNALELWARKKSFIGLKIVLPPEMYSPSFVSKQLNVLFRKGYKFLVVDLNYAINSKLIDDDYTNIIWRNARKNLTLGLQRQLSFEKCDTLEDCQRAYQIIQKNRESRGFPLRMTWHQVASTIKVVKSDFFLCKDVCSNIVAAAIVFRVAKDIVQVIYWGDLPEYSDNKTMNFLSFRLFEYYKNQDVRIIDLGPSTENSLPNYGVAEFKESIGCFLQPKYSLFKELN